MVFGEVSPWAGVVIGGTFGLVGHRVTRDTTAIVEVVITLVVFGDEVIVSGISSAVVVTEV